MSGLRQSVRKTSINQEGAIIAQGIEAKVQASSVFTQFHIPPNLFPLASIDEFGFNSQTGLFWMKSKDKTSNEFAHAEIIAMYHTTVSGQIEQNKVKNMKGFKIKEMKGRELFLSVPYDEIFIDDDEVRLKSRQHTTRNCLLISFSDNPPPPRAPPPAAAIPPPEGTPSSPPDEAPVESPPEGEAEPELAPEEE